MTSGDQVETCGYAIRAFTICEKQPVRAPDEVQG